MTTQQKTRTILTSLAVVGFAAGAHAATISNAAWPDTPVFEVVDNLNATDATSGARGLQEARGEFFQAFTPTSTFQIDKVYLLIEGVANNKTFQLRIFNVSDPNAAAPGTIGTEVLAPISMTTGTGLLTGINVLEIDLEGLEQITLNSGQSYGLGLRTLDDNDPNTTDIQNIPFTLRWDNANGYTPGRGYTDLDDSNTARLNIDYALAFTAVPEPGSLALLGLGGLCLMQRRRRA